MSGADLTEHLRIRLDGLVAVRFAQVKNITTRVDVVNEVNNFWFGFSSASETKIHEVNLQLARQRGRICFRWMSCAGALKDG